MILGDIRSNGGECNENRFFGIQPSGTVTLGNYLGAMKHFVEM